MIRQAEASLPDAGRGQSKRGSGRPIAARLGLVSAGLDLQGSQILTLAGLSMCSAQLPCRRSTDPRPRLRRDGIPAAAEPRFGDVQSFR